MTQKLTLTTQAPAAAEDETMLRKAVKRVVSSARAAGQEFPDIDDPAFALPLIDIYRCMLQYADMEKPAEPDL